MNGPQWAVVRAIVENQCFLIVTDILKKKQIEMGDSAIMNGPQWDTVRATVKSQCL